MKGEQVNGRGAIREGRDEISGQSTIASLFHEKDLGHEIRDVLAEHERIKKQSTQFPRPVLEIAQNAAITLLNWELPSTLAVAMLLVPLIEYDLLSEDRLAALFPRESTTLARRLVAWHTSTTAVEEPGADPSPAFYSMQLRRLLRRAYLELPDFSLVLLLLAEHDVHLSLLPKEVAALSEFVFVPFAEMLGIWQLRRQWLDKCLCIRYPDDYKEMRGLIEETGLTGVEEAACMPEMGKDAEKPDTSISKSKTRLSERKIVFERNQAYNHLKNTLNQCFQEDAIAPCVQLIEPSAGAALYRNKEGEAKEELINRLVVRILCDSPQDCYRVLGVVHRLGKPVTPRFSERFSDYIASPKPNGYRGLETAIMYQRETSRAILVDFRILTDEMFRLNEQGILTTFTGSPAPQQDRNAWWNRLEEHSDDFLRRRAILERFDIGTCSDLLYIFTPQGEAEYQKDGSTALDFAYYIHTELGHHATKIEVNGKAVPYSYPLRNGDLVLVHYDPHFAGPDLSWLSSVSTSAAKQEIRQRLAARAHVIHEGRSKIEHVLIKTLQTYKAQKHYTLSISTQQLDGFLFRAAQARELADREALYAEVVAGRIAPEKLVQRLVSQELAAIVTDEYGEQLDYPLHRIHFCNMCRPVPGEPLIAFEYRVGKASTGLRVHCKNNSDCMGRVKKTSVVLIRWAEQPSLQHREVVLLQIGAEPRYRLLGDILDVIYREPGVSLHTVEQQVDGKGNATITLAIEAEAVTRLVNVQAHLETVPGVRRVFSSLPSPSQLLSLSPGVKKDQHNPYTYQEVYDRLMFYDRESSIDTILKWLREPPPTRRLILHGQRRVGKTSLAKYLMHEILPEQRLAQPVWIDFQDLSQFNAQSIASMFIHAVYGVLQLPVPEPQAHEEPMLWLNRALEEAVKQRPAQRLLLLIDELNVLLDMQQHGRLGQQVFYHLRSVMSKRRDINWLLIVQDTHFQEPRRFGGAGPLFQQSLTLQVPYLDTHWARKLIIEPAQRCGMLYEETLPATILNLTNGNPYLIQVLCHELLRQAMKRTGTNITLDDLLYATHKLTSATDGPRIFHHFVHYLEAKEKIVLAAIARSLESGDWTNVAELLREIHTREKRLRPEMLHSTLNALERQGIVALRYTGRDKSGPYEEVRIPIKLFQSYVRECMDVQTAIEEWSAPGHAPGYPRGAPRV